MKPVLIVLALCAAVTDGIAQPEATAPDADRPVEATSLFGEPLLRPELSDAFREKQEALLAEARKELEANPEDELAWIWVGRRLAYLGRYQDAIVHYTQALERFPDSYKLRRHRGHRYMTIRQFDKAMKDLNEAVRLSNSEFDEFEPDGLPNVKGVPRSTTKSNIWYHLALCWSFTGSDDTASRIMYTGRKVAQERAHNDDMRCAMAYWLALWNLDDERSLKLVLEPISADMDVIENHDYHRLLLLFKGELTEADLLEDLDEGVATPTILYGVSQHRKLNGDDTGCRELLERIIEDGNWAAFGSIAAEADLARMD